MGFVMWSSLSLFLRYSLMHLRVISTYYVARLACLGFPMLLPPSRVEREQADIIMSHQLIIKIIMELAKRHVK